MKTRKQNRNNKRTEIEPFDWFIERIQTHLAFGWLSERSGEKTSCPKNFLGEEIMLCFDVYCNTIGQSNNAYSDPYNGFLWRKSPCFELFIRWFIKQITNICRKQFSRSYESRHISLLSCFVCFFVYSLFVTPWAPRASMSEARSLSFDRLCSQSSIKICY